MSPESTQNTSTTETECRELGSLLLSATAVLACESCGSPVQMPRGQQRELRSRGEN